MKRNILPSVILGTLLLSVAGAAGDPATSAEAEAEAKKWLDGLGDAGLVLEETTGEAPFKGKYVPQAKSTGFDYQCPGWWIQVGFSGEVSGKTTVAELNERLKYVALNKLPTPGLAVPGWEIQPRTPKSSFKEGVEVTALEGGKITLKVKTGFYALYGTDPKAMALVPADAPAPESAYFMLRKPFKLDLTLTAPFQAPEG